MRLKMLSFNYLLLMVLHHEVQGKRKSNPVGGLAKVIRLMIGTYLIFQHRWNKQS